MKSVKVYYPSKRNGGKVRFTVKLTVKEMLRLEAFKQEHSRPVHFHTNKDDKCIATTSKLPGGGQLEAFLNRKLDKHFV